MKNIKLFPNYNERSLQLAEELSNKLIASGYTLTDKDYDLAIAIGGDGSYLRMVKNNSFNEFIHYIGVNTGTLGFLQEVNPNELDNFIEKLGNHFYKVEPVSIQETTITTNETKDSFYSLNEIAIRNANMRIANLDVYIDSVLLENFVGDGLLIATSIGSTAYNISLGGSIVYSDLHTLQLTPIAPLNTVSYRNLLNSIIIPEDKKIEIIPNKQNNNLMIAIDGETKNYDQVEKIETGVSKKKIKCLRLKDYNYTNIIHDKFLK